MGTDKSYSVPGAALIRDRRGYSLLEMVVVMAIFTIVIIITTTAFDRLIATGRREAKTASSQIEGIVGLEMLRRDIAHAGYGLPWSFLHTPVSVFPEVTEPPADGTGVDPTDFNEATPHPLVCGTAGDDATNPGTDYLVLKSELLALKGANNTAGRWGYMNYSALPSGQGASAVKTFGEAERDLRSDDHVVVLAASMGSDLQQRKELLNSTGGVEAANFSFPIADPDFIAPQEFQPQDRDKNYIVYGVSRVAPRMPYNRADYYVYRPAAGDPDFKIPMSCNPGTGILFKAVADHAGGYSTPYPLLNCVGDMKVVLTRDEKNDGNLGYFPAASATITNLSPQQLREQVRSVTVHILTHEGKKDPTYSYPRDTILVGWKLWTETELRTQFGADWRNYRWKVYSLMVTPTNM